MTEAAEAGEPTVDDVMTRQVTVARDTDTLAFASQVLLWRAIRHLPILDPEDHLVGILSDRDVLPHVLEGPAGARPVSEYMSRNVQTIAPGAKLSEAASHLQGARIDALPVVEGGRVVGIVTTSDVLAERGRSLRRAAPVTKMRAGDVMRRRVLTSHPTDSLESAIHKLLDGDVRHLPVVDEDFRVVGILSDRDVRTAVGDPRRSLEREGGVGGALEERTVGDVMTRDTITVEASASIFTVADLFVDERIGAVPVVRDDDTLIGIISYVDVIAHFVGRPR
ncbi:MAG: CBS domain-containing protein [Polyangiaceae bacterium]|jgi:CBS-domain-containing membrane protein|nr:CBS domain-containing protein [Polyangiaceae bacterium]